jgi:hypothetical protein
MENLQPQNDDFLLNGLIADLATERAKLAQMTGQLSLLNDRIIKDIEALQKEFKEAQISLEEQLSEGLRAASEDLSSKAFNMFKDKALSKAEEATSKLEKVADRTYSKMSDLTSASKISFRKLMILMSIGGILSGTIGALGYGFFFNKFYQVNPGTKQHLAWGSALEKGWPDLTDREQKKLNKLLKENAP